MSVYLEFMAYGFSVGVFFGVLFRLFGFTSRALRGALSGSLHLD